VGGGAGDGSGNLSRTLRTMERYRPVRETGSGRRTPFANPPYWPWVLFR